MWYDEDIAEHLNAITISQKLQIPPQSIGVNTESEAFMQTCLVASRVLGEIEAEEACKIERSVSLNG